MKWIDRAERKFGHLAIPHLLHGIAFFIACAFVLSKANPHFVETLTLDPDRVMAGEVWRLVTYLFIPPGPGLFLPDWAVTVFYVSFLLWMGSGLEQSWGAFRLTVYSVISMVGITAAAFVLGVNFSTFMFVQSLFLAFARFYPEEWIYIYFILPVKIKWLAWLDGVVLVLLFTLGTMSVRAAVLVTLGNYFLFFGREIIDAARHRHETADRRRRFQSATRPSEEAMHHCTICGRTEIQAPDLEFRVAKDGHEYCLEHLPKAPPPPAAGT
jgi:hypothetical protein